MRTIGAYEVKAYFSELLREVENGETIIATRHGLPVARLSPMDKAADTFRYLTAFDTLSLEIDLEVAREALGQRIPGLGLTHGLSAYDASYLEVAMRRGLLLATQDERLTPAAPAAGVAIIQP